VKASSVNITRKIVGRWMKTLRHRARLRRSDHEVKARQTVRAVHLQVDRGRADAEFVAADTLSVALDFLALGGVTDR